MAPLYPMVLMIRRGAISTSTFPIRRVKSAFCLRLTAQTRETRGAGIRKEASAIHWTFVIYCKSRAQRRLAATSLPEQTYNVVGWK